MIFYKRGDIVLVPFPFSDQSTKKKRPAVIISSDAYNSVSNDIIIIAVTSKIEGKTTEIECILQEWETAGLLKPSSIKPALSTIEYKLVLRKLGKLTSIDISALKSFLSKLLGL